MIEPQHWSLREMENYILECQRADWVDEPHKRLKYFHLPRSWAIKGTEFSYVVARQDGKVIGVIEYFRKAGEGESHFCYLSVDPDFKNKGVSKLLIDAFCAKMRSDESVIQFGSMFSDEGRSFLMKNLVKKLDEYGLEWASGNDEMNALKAEIKTSNARRI